ncbi:hypothetical protein D039_2319A, partial [Vibrio parahaemolyticus EKP-028]
MNKQSQPA